MKIAEGIEYAIQQALADDLEKTASVEEVVLPGDSVGAGLRKIAGNLRKGVDGKIRDLPESSKADQ